MAVPRVAVVGGGVAGTLCSLVLRSRGACPVIIDAGANGLGGRLRGGAGAALSTRADAGAQFIRAKDQRLGEVLRNLEGEGCVARWEGRFGLLGQRGGFLPTNVVAGSGVRAMKPDGGAGEGGNHATDAGDFCGFVEGDRDVPTYVGVPTMADVCPKIATMAQIDVVPATTVAAARMLDGGGWALDVKGGAELATENRFDALVLATHSPSLASDVVGAIASGEEAAAAAAGEAVQEGSLASRLRGLAGGLRALADRRSPVYTVTVVLPDDVSREVPFDAASVPGSHVVQFLAREASKPGREASTAWTAVSTSALAASVLGDASIPKEEKAERAAQAVIDEMAQLLAQYAGGVPLRAPTAYHARRWGAAFSPGSLGSPQEDAVALPPWRLAICGDYVRKLDVHASPFEAAALSGMEAGERVAAYFAQA